VTDALGYADPDSTRGHARQLWEQVWRAWFIGIEADQPGMRRGYVAKRPNYSFSKQQKEIKRQRKKEEKAAKRLRKKELATLESHVDVDSTRDDSTVLADLRGAERQRPSE
jgi:hypothetical protein